MAKDQSKLRDAVDAVFGSSQYLTYDGSAYAKSKYAQIFNRASKPQYLIYATGVAIETMMGTSGTLTDYTVGLAVLAGLDKIESILPSRASLRDLYYDTKAEHRCFIEASQASALKKVKGSGVSDMVIGSALGGSLVGLSVISGEPIEALPFLSAWAAWSFGNYWRPKQVLDGNWTLLDKAPPEKQTSKVKSAMPGYAVPIRIHKCEIAPAVEL